LDLRLTDDERPVSVVVSVVIICIFAEAAKQAGLKADPK